MPINAAEYRSLATLHTKLFRRRFRAPNQLLAEAVPIAEYFQPHIAHFMTAIIRATTSTSTTCAADWRRTGDIRVADGLPGNRPRIASIREVAVRR